MKKAFRINRIGREYVSDYSYGSSVHAPFFTIKKNGNARFNWMDIEVFPYGSMDPATQSASHGRASFILYFQQTVGEDEWYGGQIKVDYRDHFGETRTLNMLIAAQKDFDGCITPEDAIFRMVAAGFVRAEEIYAGYKIPALHDGLTRFMFLDYRGHAIAHVWASSEEEAIEKFKAAYPRSDYVSVKPMGS